MSKGVIVLTEEDLRPPEWLKEMLDQRDAIDRWTWQWEGRGTRFVYGHGYAFNWGPGFAVVWAEGAERNTYNKRVASMGGNKRFVYGAEFVSRVVRPWCEETAKAHARLVASVAIDKRIRESR